MFRKRTVSSEKSMSGGNFGSSDSHLERLCSIEGADNTRPLCHGKSKRPPRCVSGSPTFVETETPLETVWRAIKLTRVRFCVNCEDTGVSGPINKHESQVFGRCLVCLVTEYRRTSILSDQTSLTSTKQSSP